MTFDPYSTLGLGRSATPDEIKSTYRKLAREHHPDSRPGDKGAENRFKDISNAYTLLSDPAKRRKFDAGEIDAHGNAFARSRAGTSNQHAYDAYRRGPASGHKPSAGESFGAKKSRFNSFFRERTTAKAKGADVTYALKVSFLDAAKGADKKVRMATGKTLKVRIPAGTESGQVMRLKNQGMDGMGGAKSGDALVEITVQNGAEWRADGADVYCEEAVTLSEALLGGRIEARTVHGPVMVTVPEGSNSGTKLRLKGRGIHRPGSDKHGDHYVTLKVVLPREDNSELKKFVKKWAAKNPYSVRKDMLKRNAAE